MDPFKYTFVGHQGLDHCNPVSSAQIELLIDATPLPSGGLAVDIGCGKAELLRRLVEKRGMRGIGVDRSPLMIAEARRRAAARAPASSLELREADGAAFAPSGTVDLAACVGATHVLGGLRLALLRLTSWVRPGGCVLIGEGHWRREPDAEFLQAMGATREDYLGPDGIDALAAASGLRPLWSSRASKEEFDRYERHHAGQIEAYAAAHPEDPHSVPMLERRRAWTDLYRRWGRDTLGFGLHLFQRG